MKYFIFVIGTILILNSCATTAPEVVEVKQEPPALFTQKKEILTDCTTLFDLDPSIQSSTEDAFTLYRDQVRFGSFEEARRLWKIAYYRAPGSDGKATYHFDDGIKIYDHFFRNESDETRKQSLVDTIMSIYDKRMACFQDDGTIKARKAFNSYYSYSQYTDSDETFQAFRDVVEEKGVESDYFIVNPFTKMLYDRLLEEKISQEEGKEWVNEIFRIIKHGKANCEDKFCEAWEVIEEYSPELLSGLEGYRGFYDCEYYMNKYWDQYVENKSDCDNVQEVYLKMVWAACDPGDPRFVELKEAKEKECYVPPPPPGTLKQAYTLLEAGEFRNAVAKFDQYVRETDDPEKKAEKLLIISKIYYAHIKNFAAARRYALEASEYKSNWGEPFMLIGKLYASSGPLCGPGRGWDSQVVTWPAIDKFRYAKRIDPSVTAEADKWIARYSQYMPDKEDVFSRLKKVGDSFFVGCWIQESTVIRTSD